MLPASQSPCIRHVRMPASGCRLEVTRPRESVDGRNIPKETFIQEYLAARETVKEVLTKFGKSVTVMLVKKNFKNHSVEAIQVITTPVQAD